MSKVVIIAIDALDSVLLHKFRNDLPNLNKIMEEGKSIKLKSVFPTDSIPAWASIYTGMNPANHGFLVERDYLSKNAHEQARNLASKIDTTYLRGKTFWDLAGEYSKKVCVINPFLCYPVWPVNGIMVSGPVFEDGTIQAFPEHISSKYSIPLMGGIGGFPLLRDLPKFIENSKALTIDEANFGLKLLQDFHWDLYYICFLTLDRIQHFFWRYFDEKDPTYPGDNSYSNVIRYFYRLFDSIVGRFIDLLDQSATLIVISDHGHGMRNTKLVSINELLRRRKLLFSKNEGSSLNFGKLLEKIKTRVVLDFIRKYNLEELAFGLARLIPKAKDMQESSFIIDFEKSIAYVSNLFGMHPYGGIEINSSLIKENITYEKIRSSIINAISSLKDQETGEGIVNWICRREELYFGKYIKKYPDVVFELNDDYGVDRTLYGSIFSTNYTHKIVSGGHKQDAAFFMYNLNRKEVIRKDATLMDVAPSILELLGIENNFDFDGISVFRE